MRVAYFYLMTADAARVRAAARAHASYWHSLALPGYCGGPFADRSGGLIVFDTETAADAERLAAGDPFREEGLLDQHWIKEWLADPAGSGEAARPTPDATTEEVRAR
jgi:hypothetical protein